MSCFEFNFTIRNIISMAVIQNTAPVLGCAILVQLLGASTPQLGSPWTFVNVCSEFSRRNWACMPFSPTAPQNNVTSGHFEGWGVAGDRSITSATKVILSTDIGGQCRGGRPTRGHHVEDLFKPRAITC